MKKERIYIFDFLRVISMFLVIVIHVSNVYMRAYEKISFDKFIVADLFNTVGRISVPIFFMISGKLLLERNLTKESYIERIKKFTFILMFWTIFYIGWNTLYLGEKYVYPNILLEIFFEPSKAHLWFMYAIIGLYLILPFVKKMMDNLTRNEENLFLGLWIGLSGVVYFIRFLSLTFLDLKLSISYPTPLVQGTYYLGYFVAGSIIFKRIMEYKETKAKELTRYCIITFILSNLITFAFVLYRSQMMNTYSDEMFAYRSIFIMASSISAFILFILYQNKITDKMNKKILLNMSKYAFSIYIIHPIFLDILKDIVKIRTFPPIIFIPLFALLLYVVTYGFVYLLDKIKVIRKVLY